MPSLLLFMGLDYYLKQTKEVTDWSYHAYNYIFFKVENITLNYTKIYIWKIKIKRYNVMYEIICSWILLHAISNYWNELLWDVYGVIDCVVISDRVECF